jgi:PAS domain S-box-containing protein
MEAWFAASPSFTVGFCMTNLAAHSRADEAGHGQVPSAPRASILLVDDQPGRLLSYEAIVSGLGVRCVRALSGREALARLLEQEFAAILLDVSMPEMDGFEVARLIRSHPRLERTPIIFVTGVQVSDLDQLKGYEVGGIDYISVPVVPDILRSKVAILVELHQRRRELQAVNRELQEARTRLELEHDQMGQHAARLRAVFEHPALITGILEAQRDDTGAITDWIVRDANANAIRIFGQTRETIIGRAYSGVHPNPEQAREAAAVFAKVLATGEVIEHESRIGDRQYLVTTFAMNDATVIASALDITARKSDLTQRRMAEQRLSAVLQSINDHLICLDSQWRFTYLNEATAQLLGRPLPELIGVCIWDLFPDAAADYYRDLHTAAREQRIITAEHYYKPWDKWFESHIYPSTDGVTVFSTDVTQRKHAELALRESEERLMLARRAARFGIHDRDLVTGTLKWDEFTCELWGVAPDARVTFEDFIAGVHPDDREGVQRAVRRALDAQGGGDYCETYRVVNQLDRITRWVESTGRVAFHNGRAVRLVGTVQDVTERVAADERLRASEERFRELANNIDQFVWTCDRLGYATWYNDRFYQYTGTTFAEIQGEGWTSIVHPAHVERVTSRVPQCVQEGRVWEDTFPVRGKDGKYRWFLSRAIPIHDSAGQVVRWLGTNTDVTELRDLEDALKEADRRKDEFLAMLAHELRNPLAPIRNAANVLARREGRDDIERSLLAMIQRQGAQLARLLDDLLDAARITQGHVELRFERVALRSCIDLAVEIAAPMIRERQHKLAVEQTLEPLHVRADKVRVVQCIANVLLNAAKYTNEGGEIRIETRQKDGRVMIEISDSGIGISAELLPRIFDLFIQGDRSLDRSQGGLGIGLAICKRLIEMHGGDVVATSPGVGKGSTFSIYLPLETAPEQLGEGRELKKPRGVRVLIVDDNRDAADSLAMMLELDGHRTRTAYSPEAALEEARSFAPDLILLDIGLPRMDGYEVARRLRLAESRARVVALTGYGQLADKERSATAGFVAHLVKPIDPAALAEVLDASYVAEG